MRFRAKADDAPSILFDAGDRGTRKGPSPVQGTLLSVMACTAADVVLILQKERVPFTSLEITADAERATEDPKVFTKIRLHYQVRGNGIKESAGKRGIDPFSEEYFPGGIMARRGGGGFVNTSQNFPLGGLFLKPHAPPPPP